MAKQGIVQTKDCSGIMGTRHSETLVSLVWSVEKSLVFGCGSLKEVYHKKQPSWFQQFMPGVGISPRFGCGDIGSTSLHSGFEKGAGGICGFREPPGLRRSEETWRPQQVYNLSPFVVLTRVCEQAGRFLERAARGR